MEGVTSDQVYVPRGPASTSWWPARVGPLLSRQQRSSRAQVRGLSSNEPAPHLKRSARGGLRVCEEAPVMQACSPASANGGLQLPADGGWVRLGRQETRRGQLASQGAGSSSAAGSQGHDRRPHGHGRLRHGHCGPQGGDLGPSQGRCTLPPPAEQRVWTTRRSTGEPPGRSAAREGCASARLPGQRGRCGREGGRIATWSGTRPLDRCQPRWSLALCYAAWMCILSALPRASNASSCVQCSPTLPVRLDGMSVGTDPKALQGEAFPSQPLLTLRNGDDELLLNEPSGEPPVQCCIAP